MMRDNTMSVRCSLLPGRGTFVVANDVIRFETKTNAKTIPVAPTFLYKDRGWIMGDEVVTFRGECMWPAVQLEDAYAYGTVVWGKTQDGVFVGDGRNASCYASWDMACVQRLSRFSTTFDVVYIDVQKPHVYVVTYRRDEKDDVFKKLDAHVKQVFNAGPDPYPWKRAIATATTNKWTLDDWVYVFSDDVEDLDEEEEEDEDDEDECWEPPAKRARVSSSEEEDEESLDEESDSDLEAFST